MSLLTLLLVLGMIGFLAWLIGELLPMPSNIRKLIYVVAFVVAVLYVLNAIGLLHFVDVGVPKIR